MQPESFNEWYGPKPATRAQVAAFVRANRIRYDESAEGTLCGILGCPLVHPSVGAVSKNGKQPCALFIRGKYVPACVYCTTYLTDPHVQAQVVAVEKEAMALWAGGLIEGDPNVGVHGGEREAGGDEPPFLDNDWL